MQRLTPLKNHQQEIQLIINRTVIAFIVITCSILLLMGRLIYLQVYKHNLYITLSTKNWLDLVPIEPTRGLIYDRNQVLLAENIPVFSLDVIPMQATNLATTLLQLNKIITLSENDMIQFNKQLKQHRRFDEIPLKLRLTEDEVNRFAENQHQFPGVVIKARLMRHYPYEKSFSHVIGYMGRINTQELQEIDTTNYSASYYIGKLGIEKYYEEALHGRRGAIVAIQPATGQVLAMVSEPGYDPNQFVLGMSQSNYQTLQQSQDRPLYNRALRG